MYIKYYIIIIIIRLNFRNDYYFILISKSIYIFIHDYMKFYSIKKTLNKK